MRPLTAVCGDKYYVVQIYADMLFPRHSPVAWLKPSFFKAVCMGWWRLQHQLSYQTTIITAVTNISDKGEDSG
jgi:hypothetical protein